ncbi:spore germination protein [Ammoniphilus resinae]|uniref:Spore germination protein PA n=1 Tax=Ammoniphilus resinae TaxID=861532 RepID=A0ABS4GQ42_9BACL|nr:spore germination protein [Ammoniphilus resinae]MBP1932402.1 spore germination protein PA [Ammoniphilus resinae]
MPAMVGTVNINSLSGIMNIGDVHKIAPRNYSKTFAGGGSFNSGDNLNVHNENSVIHVYDRGSPRLDFDTQKERVR